MWNDSYDDVQTTAQYALDLSEWIKSEEWRGLEHFYGPEVTLFKRGWR